MTGRLLNAEKAHGLGLINHLVTLDELNSAVRRVARDFASKPSVAWVRAKSRFKGNALVVFDEAFRARVL